MNINIFLRILLLIVGISLVIRFLGASLYELSFSALEKPPLSPNNENNRTLIRKFFRLLVAYISVIMSISMPITVIINYLANERIAIINYLTNESFNKLPDALDLRTYIAVATIVGIIAAIAVRILVITQKDRFSGIIGGLFYQLVIVASAFLIFFDPIGSLDLSSADIIYPIFSTLADFALEGLFFVGFAILSVCIIICELLLRDNS